MIHWPDIPRHMQKVKKKRVKQEILNFRKINMHVNFVSVFATLLSS